MKIAVLSHTNVSGYYAATLMERGSSSHHQRWRCDPRYWVAAVLGMRWMLVAGNEPDLLGIADCMEASGKKVWRQLAEVPFAS